MSKLQNVTKKTLDTQHVNKLQEFQERELAIKNLQEDIEEYSELITKYKS